MEDESSISDKERHIIMLISDDGPKAAQAGDSAAAIEKFSLAFELAKELDEIPCVTLQRAALDSLIKVLVPHPNKGSNPYIPTKADTKILRTIKDDMSVLRLFRVKAAHALVKIQGIYQRNSGKGAETLREIIALVQGASEAEKKKAVFIEQPNGERKFLAQGTLLEKYKDEAKYTLDRVTNSQQDFSYSSSFTINAEFMGNNWINTPNGTAVPRDSPGLLARVAAGGDKCDWCGKQQARQQPNHRGNLRRCTRCKLMYYCSRECIRAAWKAGHKQACRKKDEIKVGDIMKLVNLPHGAPTGHLVQVLSPVPNDQDKWMVQLLIVKQCPPTPFSTENLAHIRPEK